MLDYASRQRCAPNVTDAQLAAFEKRIKDEAAYVDAVLYGRALPAIPPSEFEIAAEAEVARLWAEKVAEYQAMTKPALRQAIVAMGGRVSGDFQPLHSGSTKADTVKAALQVWAGTIYTRYTGVIHEWVPVPDVY